MQGTGIRRSSKFTATGVWTIRYSYDCSNFGSSGSFQILLYDESVGLSEVAVNELGEKGSSSQPEYKPGRFYLGIKSECAWHVDVVG
jgi:hypothetical protein